MDREPKPEYDSGTPAIGGPSQGISLAAQLYNDATELLRASGPVPEGAARSHCIGKCLCTAAGVLGILYRDFPTLSRFRDAMGEEHDVWFESPLVWKATHANKFGIVAGSNRKACALDYLLRVEFTSLYFGMPWDLRGIWLDPFNRIRIVTTQPAIEGRPATRLEIEQFFETTGFVSQQLDGSEVWIAHRLGLVATDAYPDNFVVQQDGLVFPIDIPIAAVAE